MFGASLAICGLLLGPGGYTVPKSRTPVADLTTPSHRHVEILRIDRDFHDTPWGIVLDGWMSRAGGPSIDQLHLWWVKDAEQGVRRPFSDDMRRLLEVRYEPVSDTTWKVNLVSDRKRFVFQVELDANGRPQAYVDARVSEGGIVPHCRATWSKIQARRFLGVPVGVKRLRVACVDDEGKRHRGVLPYRRVR